VSPLLITLLVVAGIVVLIAIGYFNHIVENNKLERARRKADLSDRLRRCENLSEAFPGQLMSPPLKLLLTRLQLYYLEQLLPLDKGNAALRPRMQELQAQIGLGDAIKVGNPPRQILNEAMAKEVRFQLEGLHGQIAHANQIGVLGAAESKNWSREIRHLLNLLHIELFSNMGMAFLQQNQPGQARLAFERGVQYLTSSPTGSAISSKCSCCSASSSAPMPWCCNRPPHPPTNTASWPRAWAPSKATTNGRRRTSTTEDVRAPRSPSKAPRRLSVAHRLHLDRGGWLHATRLPRSDGLAIQPTNVSPCVG